RAAARASERGARERSAVRRHRAGHRPRLVRPPGHPLPWFGRPRPRRRQQDRAFRPCPIAGALITARRKKESMMTAFVFPGQGSHKVGMGAELADASAVAREVFEEVDDALGQNLSRIMREGPEEELVPTANAQPAIMATAIAVLRVLERDAGLSIAEKGRAVAGHSLGEYTARCAAGVFSLSDTARLLRIRGQAMQAAVTVSVIAICALQRSDI